MRIDVHAAYVSQYTYLHVGPARYSIKVLSANTNWTVTIERTGS